MRSALRPLSWLLSSQKKSLLDLRDMLANGCLLLMNAPTGITLMIEQFVTDIAVT
jgi:hypothetical protein